MVIEKECMKGLVAVIESAPDTRSLIVAMEGLNHALKHGSQKLTPEGDNLYGLEFEKLGGLDLLEGL